MTTSSLFNHFPFADVIAEYQQYVIIAALVVAILIYMNISHRLTHILFEKDTPVRDVLGILWSPVWTKTSKELGQPHLQMILHMAFLMIAVLSAYLMKLI